MAATVLPNTEIFKLFVTTVNALPADKLPRLLNRICTRLTERGTQFFTKDEEAQLCDYLSLSLDVVRILIQSLALIYDVAASTAMKAPALLTAMGNAGIDEATATAIAQVWVTESPAVLNTLKAQSFGAPAVLTDCDVKIGLGIGSAARTRDARTTALLTLTATEDVPSAAARGMTPSLAAAVAGRATDAATAELAADVLARTHECDIAFDRDALAAFLEKLDRIQQQIDSLSA